MLTVLEVWLAFNAVVLFAALVHALVMERVDRALRGRPDEGVFDWEAAERQMVGARR